MTVEELGRLLSQTNVRGEVGLPLLGVSVAAGVRPRFESDGRPAPSLDLSNYKTVEPGNIVMNALGKPHGSIGRSSLRGITSPAYWVLEPTAQLDSNYAHHLLRSHWMVQRLAGLGKNQPPNQFDISWDVFRRIKVSVPTLALQRRIAEFLDDRVSRIDRIIAARQSQLALLTLQETAGIQGIFDASAQRFGLIRLGYLLRQLEQGWSPQAEAQSADEHEWGVMRSGCVNGGKFHASDNKRLPLHLKPVTKYEIRGGDLLMSRASGSLDLIGSVAVVPDDVRERLLLCDKVYRLTPNSDWSSEFLAPMLRSRGNRDRIRLGVSGADGMANNLPSGVIRDLRVPAASHAGQVEVARQAHRLSQQTESVRTGVSRSIDLFAEFKTSLITAAVTGELDVTTAGSNIPG